MPPPEIPKHTQIGLAQSLIDAPAAPAAGVSGPVPPPGPFPGLWCFAGDPWGSSTCGHITHSASPSHGVSPFSFSKKVYLFIFGYAGSMETYTAAVAAAKSLQSCPTLCDPIDGSPPGSPVPGILQARTLEWGAIAFSFRPLVKRKKKCVI